MWKLALKSKVNNLHPITGNTFKIKIIKFYDSIG